MGDAVLRLSLGLTWAHARPNGRVMSRNALGAKALPEQDAHSAESDGKKQGK